jgi:hypothetical protein
VTGVGLLAGLAVCAGLVTGCSSPNATPGAAGPGTTCGTARTAADVPVVVKVTKGTVSCRTALRVEAEYAARVKDGQVRGNGGGAPVRVSGWTCQGYPTPEVLSTGNASQCRSGGAAILAELPVPAPPDAAAAAQLRADGPAEHAGRAGRRPGRRAVESARSAAGRAQAPGRADHLHLVPAAGLGPVERRVRGRHQVSELALTAAVHRGHPD